MPGAPWIGLVSLALLVASVAVHVLAHVYVAAQLDLDIDSIVVGPLGDLGTDHSAGIPRSQLLVALSGPAANLLVVVVCLPCLIMLGHHNAAEILHPLAPVGLTEGSITIVALKLTIWINWLLALCNLLPAFPFDGGRIARAAVQLFRPCTPRHTADRIVTRTAKVASFALLLLAWLSTMSLQSTALVPPWFALCMLGIVLYFCAQHEDEQRYARSEHSGDFDQSDGTGYAQDYPTTERSHGDFHFEDDEHDSGALERWIDHRRESRQRRQEEIEAAEDALVDEILARVHNEGVNSLTPEERSLLERASMRYRSREEQS